MAIAEPRLGALQSRPAAHAAGRATPAIKLWATAGAVVSVVQAYILIKWVTGPYFERVEPGPSEPPGWMKTTIDVYTAAGIVAMLAVLYWFLVRPWRRDGRISLDGLLCLVWFQLYWIVDPMFDYFGYMFTFNSYAWNMGSWTAEVPGWIAPAEPGRMLAEPILWVAPVYIYVCFGGTVVMGALMRRLQGRFGFGPLWTILACWVFAVVLITIIEAAIWMRLGLYTWPGAIEELTLFHGKYYQYPLNESFFWGTAWTAMAAIRYFRNDKGETIAERGASELRVGGPRHTCVRYLALVGVGFTTYFVLYTIPQAGFFSSHQDEWPADIQKRSYFTNHLCGPGTTMACPGPSVPIPRRESAHLDTEGRVVVPPGTKPPGQSTLERFAETP